MVKSASIFGDQEHRYDGVDITMQGRFPNGAMLTGGVSIGRTVLDTCDVIAGNPQLRVQAGGGQNVSTRANNRSSVCRIVPPWASSTNIKLAGILPLPYNIRLSATWQNLPAIETGADLVLGRGAARGQLGRNLTGGGADRLVQLHTQQSNYTEPRANQIDFRFSRRFQVGTARIEPQFNLYNLTNANDILRVVTRYGGAWQNARNVLPARLIKLGLQIDF